MDAAGKTKNKEQDFSDIQKAAEIVENRMRSDEDFPDLSKQLLINRTSSPGSHRYFVEPYKSSFGPLIEHGAFVPFPKEIMQQYSRVECASFMGILPEINRVWMTVDNILYLWNYEQPEDCLVFDDVSEVIVSVALSTPKPGIFLDSVKFLLVLATPVEIVMLALCSAADEKAGQSFAQQRLKIVPTTYRLPSDNVTMLKIVGSQCGRVFMLGSDHGLYELEYTNGESSWREALFLGGSSTDGGARKCRKVNHLGWQLTALLPNVFSQLGLAPEDPFVDIVLDNARNVLYASTRRGKLTVLYLGVEGKETHVVETGFDLFEHAKQFLAGQQFSGSFSIPPSAFTNSAAPSFHVVGLFPVPLQDSLSLHLVVALASGIRVYLALRSGSGGFSTAFVPPTVTLGAGAFAQTQAQEIPSGLSVRGVRAPPSPSTLAQCAREREGESAEDINASFASAPSSSSFFAAAGEEEHGALPSFIPSQPLTVSKAWCAGGVCLFSLDKSQRPDELLCLFEDLFSRNPSAAYGSSSGMSTFTNECVAALKEGVSVGLTATQSGGKILDIKEGSPLLSDALSAQLQTLFAFSKSPSSVGAFSREMRTHHALTSHIERDRDTESGREQERGFLSSWFGVGGSADEEKKTPARTPLSLCNALSPSVPVSAEAGIEKENLGNLVPLGEIATQQCPFGERETMGARAYTQRQLVVLTNTGVHIMRKLRVADVLHRLLSHVDLRAQELLQKFFSGYGALQTATMCVGIAVGVPRPLSPLSPTLSDAVYRVSEHIQARAIQTVLSSTPGSAYKAVVPAPAYASSAVSVTTATADTQAGTGLLVAKDFTPSTMHDALFLFFSRQVRAFWYRPVFVSVPAGAHPSVRLASLWSVPLINEMRHSLSNLRLLLVHFFGAAIRTASSDSSSAFVPATQTQAQTHTHRDRDLVTAQMSAQTRVALSAEKELSLRAKAAEDASLRTLYLLLSRSLHALSLIELLLVAEKDWRVSLSASPLLQSAMRDLDKWCFRSLVLSARAHDTLKRVSFALLRTLLLANKGELAERATQFLASNAYHFFSAGDQYAFRAQSLLQELERERQQQTEREHVSSAIASSVCEEEKKKVNECVSLLLRAADFWLSLTDVQGTDSELQRACDAVVLSLGTLGRDCVIDLCLRAAANFSPSASRAAAVSTVSVREKEREKERADIWDSSLYHGGSVLNERERERAVVSCYECLVHTTLSLAARANTLGSGAVSASKLLVSLSPADALSSLHAVESETLCMIQRALRLSTDKRLHELFFARLLTDDSTRRLLLQINSPFIEEYLQTHDADLLYAYYIAQVPDRDSQFAKAANLMFVLATTTEDVHIDERVKYLRESVSSAKEAASPHDGLAAKDKLLVDNVQDLQDLLDVAEFQKDIASLLDEDYKQYHEMTSSSRSQYTEAQVQTLRDMKECVRRLKMKLLNISELFNDVCVPYHLWNMSLRLLELSNTLDEDLIAKLWRSYIYRFVPAQSSINEAIDFLSRKKTSSYIMIDWRHESLISGKSFENPETWLSLMMGAVSSLAEQLKAGSLPPFVPVPVIVRELEEIFNTLHVLGRTSVPRTAVSDMLRELRVPTPFVVASYFMLLEEFQHASNERQLHLVASILEVIDSWIKASKDNADLQGDLELSIFDGHMREWLAEIGKKLTSLKKDSRWADLVDRMLKQELEISGRVFEFHQQS